MHTHRHHTESGFTLIEVMVSVSIFAIIVSVGIGALFNMNTSYTYSKAQQRLMDHINFAMETMSRELRTGFDYVCGSDDMTSSSLTPTSCGVTGSNRIVFAADFDQTGYDIIGYRLSNQKLQKANGAGASFFDLLPEEVAVEEFIVRVSSDIDTQPIVIVTLVGTTTVRQRTEEFVLHTALTQRQPNL